MKRYGLWMVSVLGWCGANGVNAAEQAEFAFRWDVSKGGPTSVEKVAESLNLKAKKPKKFQVQYFEIALPSSIPDGYRVLGRERSEIGENPDSTMKMRGLKPLPNGLPKWECTSPAERKDEVDLAFENSDDVKRAFSVSCTLKDSRLSGILPKGYVATPRKCSNYMERTKAGSATLEVKIEKWSLPKGRVVIEVSMEGVDTPTDFEKFRERVVKPLIDLKAEPLKESKTELGSDC